MPSALHKSAPSGSSTGTDLGRYTQPFQGHQSILFDIVYVEENGLLRHSLSRNLVKVDIECLGYLYSGYVHEARRTP